MYCDLYEQSGSEIIQQLGKRYAQYRKRMGLTQKLPENPRALFKKQQKRK